MKKKKKYIYRKYCILPYKSKYKIIYEILCFVIEMVVYGCEERRYKMEIMDIFAYGYLYLPIIGSILYWEV